MYVIEFAPPMSGLDGSFNTVRLGGTWAKRLQQGEKILLMDKPKSSIFATAIVEGVIVGKLRDVAASHAAFNHNQKGTDAEGAPERLMTAMKKRYGPHKVNDNSRVTAIYLRVIDEKDHLP